MPGSSVRGELVVNVGQVTGHTRCVQEQLVRCMESPLAEVPTELLQRCYLAAFAAYRDKSAQQKQPDPS
jgi:hypothetical protein